MKKSLLLLLAGMLVTASIASAAVHEGEFSISPVIGGYTFDKPQAMRSDINVIYGLRGGYNFTKRFGVEGLFDYVDATNGKYNTDAGLYRYGADFLYHFFPDNKFVPYAALGFSGLNFSDNKGFKNTVRGVFDYGVGAKYFLSDKFALRADVRHLIYYMDYPYSTGMERHTTDNLEYTIGAFIPFGGVKPTVKPVEPVPVPVAEPAPVPAVVEPPPAPAAAPTASLTATPESITKGQSASLNWTSKNASTCDIQPGIGAVPPQGARSVVPDSTTSYTITCSGAGGTAGSAATVTVLSPKATAAAERFCSKPAILEIHFDTDKSDIKPQYEAELKTVGEFLKEFPKAKGEISGHTDSTASKAHNQKLSERRAVAVEKYISTKFGIKANRITTKGYGETKPIASNKTKEGRAKNRRIEANFICN